MSTWKIPITVLASAMSLAMSASPMPPQAAPKADRATIKLFDATASVPLPNWQKGDDVGAESEINRLENESSFLMEFVPKNDSFTDWRRLYAIRADVTPSLPLADAYNGQVNIYSSVCGKDDVRLQKLSASDAHVLFALICPSSPDGPRKFGYGPDVGEISVFWIGRHNGTIIKIFHHWRGENFDPEDQGSWPVRQEQVQQVIDRFGAIKVW